MVSSGLGSYVGAGKDFEKSLGFSGVTEFVEKKVEGYERFFPLLFPKRIARIELTKSAVCHESSKCHRERKTTLLPHESKKIF